MKKEHQVLLFFIFGLLAFEFTNAQISTCSGSANLNPIQDGAPVFIKQVKNGKLYTVGNDEEKFFVAHVWGSAYEMGYAQGQLLKDQINELVPLMLAHFEGEVESAIDKYIGKDLATYVAEFGLISALDLTYEFVREYSPPHFFEEMKGIAEASGVSYDSLVQIHMLPELVKAGCSIYGALKTATPDGRLYQLRALDWDVSGPMQNYPIVTIYHPNDGHAFANVGWTGWIASITGMSSVQMAMSEKVTDHEFGTTSRLGYPFNFLIRDVLQFDNDLDAAITRMTNADRTCAIWLGCGDGKPEVNRVNIFQYSYSELVVINSDTVIQYPSNSSDYVHPLIKDVVYWGVNQPCYSALLQKYHGNITAENTIQNIIPVSQTGNLHAVVYDLTHMFMYVSNARAQSESGPDNAYDRAFVKLDMNALFAEQPPQL